MERQRGDDSKRAGAVSDVHIVGSNAGSLESGRIRLFHGIVVYTAWRADSTADEGAHLVTAHRRQDALHEQHTA